MSKRVGAATILMENKISVTSFSAVGGKKEGEGPMRDCFDYIDSDDRFGQNSFEEAESAMQGIAMQNMLEKREIEPGELSMMFGGDLLNQCIGTSFGVFDFRVPYIGIYGACSTMSEGLMLAAMSVDSGAGDRVAAITSSHFCTAERQYRMPLDYGGQRTPTSQWTATASGALLVERGQKPPYVRAVTVGRMEDKGIKDANNMGAAMAPAAYSTIKRFFEDTGTEPGQFDRIVTGDLGSVGSRILCELLHRDGIEIYDRHLDCGRMIYSEEQDVHAGGSGCGCAASMLCGYFLPQIRDGSLKNILFAATGALLSPTSTMQGKSIPGISHLVWISGES
ncbi:MAG TPA: stage V sporulation protein AD [Candidatus Faeciplasma pullistercoris]|uniref:Stage V sporulation protein AD n=1 Tax=Candidatus Faeciplasma pullistercoris TaxID=2840800 RepID=A0A9D1GU10_9FIRM|nr:stage V sporulation protein AD [Candidatus Faeciplasma pullistercoris]